MRAILRCFPNQFFASLALSGLIVGLVTSKVVLSVATITLMCNAFINIHAGKNFRVWLSDRSNQWFIALFLAYLLSGFYSSDTAFWVDRCRTKLPFLALPLGFTAIKTFTKKRFSTWLALYFFVIAAASVVVFINYLFHFEELNKYLTYGQPIPAPLNDHIRFSIEVAFAIITGAYLYVNHYFTQRYLKIIAGATIVFLIIFIHVFAVRTGIVALYITTIILFVRWVIVRKVYFKALTAGVVGAVIIFCAFQYIPSLKNRMSYFRYEIGLIQKGELNPGHSDAQRILSIRYGMDIASRHPVIGIGAGDIKSEMDYLYKKNAGDVTIRSKLPHNQFVYVFAATGLIGLCIFLISILHPWLLRKRYHDILFTSFLCIMIFSFLTEHTLEMQIGTAFYLLFLLLIRKQIDDSKMIPGHA